MCSRALLVAALTGLFSIVAGSPEGPSQAPSRGRSYAWYSARIGPWAMADLPQIPTVPPSPGAHPIVQREPSGSLMPWRRFLSN